VTVSGVGADEIWYNPGDQRVYFGGYQSINVPVVDARINATGPVAMLVIGHTVPTGQTGVAQTTHSIAADEVNRKVFIPVSNAGIQVWRNGSTVAATPNPIPVALGAYGATTLNWNIPNAQNVEIHLNSPDGPLLASGTGRGSVQTGAWVRHGTTFYVQNVTGGLPLTSANTLDTIVADLQYHTAATAGTPSR